MTSSTTSTTLKGLLEDALRTFFVCPDALQEQLNTLSAGHAEQLLLQPDSNHSDEACQHFERAAHAANQHLFGPSAPKVSQQQVASAQLHRLLLSKNCRRPGFENLVQLCKYASSTSGSNVAQQQCKTVNSPLLRLLRRVAHWYYYRVMFDPLEELVKLNSEYELLFQLMTPHQQISCMADILLVLACPDLQQHSAGQLDTPLHTATLLSMLKMAQQLACAEAALQEQEQQLCDLQQRMQTLRKQDQDSTSQQLESLQQQHNKHQQEALDVRAVLTSPPVALLQLCRQQSQLVTGLPLQHQQGLWPHNDAIGRESFRQHFGALLDIARQHDQGQLEVLGPRLFQVAQQQSNTAKAVGAFLSQLGALPHKQLLLWYYAQEPHRQPGQHATHTAAVAYWLQQCCTALPALGQQQLEMRPGEDPLHTLLLWVSNAVNGGAQQSAQGQQQQQQQQQGSPAYKQAEHHQQQLQHPAEALRQVLDVVLSALQYRHCVHMQQWDLQGDHGRSQQLLLTVLHCHCMQLLSDARDTLPPEACALGTTTSSSNGQHGKASSAGVSDGGGSTSSATARTAPITDPGADSAACTEIRQWPCPKAGGDKQQTQQQQAWHQCLQQARQSLLQFLRLCNHWQHSNPSIGCNNLLQLHMLLEATVKTIIQPGPGRDRDSLYAGQIAWLLTTLYGQRLRGADLHKHHQEQLRVATKHAEQGARNQHGAALAALQVLQDIQQEQQPLDAALLQELRQLQQLQQLQQQHQQQLAGQMHRAAVTGGLATGPLGNSTASSRQGNAERAATSLLRDGAVEAYIMCHHLCEEIKGSSSSEHRELFRRIAEHCGCCNVQQVLLLVEVCMALLQVVAASGSAQAIQVLLPLLRRWTLDQKQQFLQLKQLMRLCQVQEAVQCDALRFWRACRSALLTGERHRQQQQQHRAAASTAAPTAHASSAADPPGDLQPNPLACDSQQVAPGSAEVLRLRGGQPGSSIGASEDEADATIGADLASAAEHTQQQLSPVSPPDVGGPSSSLQGDSVAAVPYGGAAPAAPTQGAARSARSALRNVNRMVQDALDSGNIQKMQATAAALADLLLALLVQEPAIAPIMRPTLDRCQNMPNSEQQTKEQLQQLHNTLGRCVMVLETLRSTAAGGTEAAEAAAAACAGHSDGVISHSGGAGGSSSGKAASSGSAAAAAAVFANLQDSSCSPTPCPTALMDSLRDLQDYWVHRRQQAAARHKQQQQQQQQGVLEPHWQEVQQQQRKLEQLSSRLRDMQHFCGMQPAAAAAWVDLLEFVRWEDDPQLHELQRQVTRVLDTLGMLGLPGPGGTSPGDGEPEAGSDCTERALLTLLLVEARVDDLFEAVEHQRMWTGAVALLHQALMAAHDKVLDMVKCYEAEWAGCQVMAQHLLVNQLEQFCSGPNKAFLSCVEHVEVGSDLERLGAAAQQWVELMQRLLAALEPMEVRHYSDKELLQLVLGSIRGQVRLCELLPAGLRGMQHVMHLDSWLTRAGRTLQGHIRRFRRLERLLSTGAADTHLAVLLQQGVQPCSRQASRVLSEFVNAHAVLRRALETTLVPNAWGVLQHAFNLLCALREMQNSRAGRGPEEVTLALGHLQEPVQGVLGQLVAYLFSIVPDLPELQLSAEHMGRLVLMGPRDIVQQVMLCVSQQPAAASLWFLVPTEMEAPDCMAQRATGAWRPHRCRSRSSHPRSAGKDRVLPAWQQPALTQRSRRPAAAAAAASSQAAQPDSSSSSSSSSSEDSPPGSPARWASVDGCHAHQCSFGWGWPSSDDEVAMRTTRAAAACTEVARHIYATCEHLARSGTPQQSSWARQNISSAKIRFTDSRQRCRQMLQLLPEECLADCIQTAAESSDDAVTSVGFSSSSDSDASDTSSSDDDSSSRGGQAPPAAGRSGGRSHQNEGLSTDARNRRSQQRRQRYARSYTWGGTRPWRAQRVCRLLRQQALLNQVAQLQQQADIAVARLQACQRSCGATPGPAAGHRAAAASTAGVSMTASASTSQCEQHSGRGAGVCFDPGQAPGDATSAQCSSGRAASHPAVLRFMPEKLSWDTGAGAGTSGQPPAALHHMKASIMAAEGPSSDSSTAVAQLSKQLCQAQEHLQQQLCGADGTQLRQLLHSRQQQRQQPAGKQQPAGNDGGSCSMRQLIWDLLVQIKPGACHWYKHGAQHWQQQHQSSQQLQQKAGFSGAVQLASGDVFVPDCSSVELWSVLCHSIASDLLLVPPSIRDMLGNGWAAGAGRLGPLGSADSSTSSRTGNAAVRMLVLQYARAARRQYTQGYAAYQLLWPLLVMQLLAEPGETLTELQPASAPAVAAALTAVSQQAAGGLQPLFAAAAEQAGFPCWGTAQHAGTADAPFGAASSSGSSSRHVDEATRQSCQPGLTLLHLTSQLGCCFPGSPSGSLPWLQLLSRYHSLSDALAAQPKLAGAAQTHHGSAGSNQPGVAGDAGGEEYDSVMAMAVALRSLGIPLPPTAAALLEVVQARRDDGGGIMRALAAPLGDGGQGQQLPAASRCLHSVHLSAQHQHRQQHQQQQQAAAAYGWWLHAGRLMAVHPRDWQQHLAHHLPAQATGAAACAHDQAPGACSGDSSRDKLGNRIDLLADVLCDWCMQPLSQLQASTASQRQEDSQACKSDGSCGNGSSSSNSNPALGCPSCGVAQYCSADCAGAAKKVHNANCWRLQALSRDGSSWQRLHHHCGTSGPHTFFTV